MFTGAAVVASVFIGSVWAGEQGNHQKIQEGEPCSVCVSGDGCELLPHVALRWSYGAPAWNQAASSL